jgi:Uma2 family endonuclease
MEQIKKAKSINWEDFLKIEEQSTDLFEYDGTIIKMEVPRPENQECSSRLNDILKVYFKNSKCVVYYAPFGLMYDYEEKGAEGKQVQPDLVVLCYENNRRESFFNSKFYGVPPIVVEIVSPSNWKYDYNGKKDIYEKIGVAEYIIVNLYTREVWIYNLDAETRMYELPMVYKNDEVAKSNIFSDLQIDLKELFSDIEVDPNDISKFRSKVIKFNTR